MALRRESKSMQRSVMFDALRVIPVFYVIAIVHAGQYSAVLRDAIDNHFPAWGYIVGAMATMFFISGYLLAMRAKIHAWSDAARFYQKRLVRILPLYALALVTFQPASSWYIKPLALLGLNNFVPGIGENGSARNLLTLWFVSVLIVFYYVFPLIIRFKTSKSRILFCIGVELLLAAGVYFFKWETRMIYYFPFFALGVVASIFSEKTIFLASLVLGGVYGVIRLSGVIDNIEILLRPARTFVVVAFSCSLSFASCLRKPLEVLAYSSFCAYLFHRQVFGLLKLMQLPDGCLRICVIYFVLVPLSIVVGWCVQYCYDKSVNHLLKDRA